jgi:hypothetical protein
VIQVNPGTVDRDAPCGPGSHARSGTGNAGERHQRGARGAS